MSRRIGVRTISNPAGVGLMGKVDTDLGFASAEALDSINVTAATDTTEKGITIAGPPGSSIVRASLIVLLTALNDTANAQKIDVDTKARPQGGSWTTFFSKTDVIGFGAVDGATTSITLVSDVSSIVTADRTYGLKCTITQSSANAVRYTTEYILVVTYRRSVP